LTGKTIEYIGPVPITMLSIMSYVTSHTGQLSLAIPLWVGAMSIPAAKAEA